MSSVVMERSVPVSLAPAVKERMEEFVAGVALASMNHPAQRENAERYVRGLLAAGPRKSLEPLVERLGGEGDYQSLQQFLADSPWDAQRVIQAVVERVAPVLDVQAWVLDDTGFPKDGKHSPGVKRQYSGTLGKVGNCQIGVSVHAVSETGTLPLGWALYLPEDWCEDPERRRKAKIPEAVVFHTKPELGVALIERAAGFQIERAPVLGDAAYGDNTGLRTALESGGIEYVLSISPDVAVFESDTAFEVPARRAGSRGPAPSTPRPDREAVSVEHLARSLGEDDFHTVTFRGKGKTRVRSRFAFQRVTAGHPVIRDNEPPREEWIIIEWPAGRDAPSDYWISNLPAKTKPERLARLARLRWMIELDYRQLKGELGLDHYEGRSYLGWQHHTALVTTAHAFLTLERQNPKAQRRASHFPKRSAYSSPSSTAGPDTATHATSQ
ncbi:MAG: IS701 family transposase [Solirubrobacteraceae bacterium]